MASSAHAECYADYKAKQDDPLRLHYGVTQVTGDCTIDNATLETKTKLEGTPWTLLTVLDVFDETGLEQRKESAGEFFLRF